MTRARDIANLVDANGDIVAGALDNVPPADLVNDTTPQLGGNLDGQTNTLGNVSLVGVGSSTTSGRFGSGLTVRNSIPEVHLKRDDGNGEAALLLDNASSTQRLFVGTYNANQETHIGTNGTQRIVVDASGRVTMPNQPAFYARRTIAGDNRPTGTCTEWAISGTGSFNRGSHFNTSTGRFTAPVAGAYLFAANPGYKQQNITFNWYWQINGSNMQEGVRVVGGLTNHSTFTGATIVTLNANDYVSINMNSLHHVNVTYNSFSGYLLG